MIKSSLENKFSKKVVEKLLKEEKLSFIRRVKDREEKEVQEKKMKKYL